MKLDENLVIEFEDSEKEVVLRNLRKLYQDEVNLSYELFVEKYPEINVQCLGGGDLPAIISRSSFINVFKGNKTSFTSKLILNACRVAAMLINQKTDDPKELALLFLRNNFDVHVAKKDKAVSIDYFLHKFLLYRILPETQQVAIGMLDLSKNKDGEISGALLVTHRQIIDEIEEWKYVREAWGKGSISAISDYIQNNPIPTGLSVYTVSRVQNFSNYSTIGFNAALTNSSQKQLLLCSENLSDYIHSFFIGLGAFSSFSDRHGFEAELCCLYRVDSLKDFQPIKKDIIQAALEQTQNTACTLSYNSRLFRNFFFKVQGCLNNRKALLNLDDPEE